MFKLNKDNIYHLPKKGQRNLKNKKSLRNAVINKGMLKNNEIIDKFSNIRLATKQEIDTYIKAKFKYVNIYNNLSIILTISLILSILLIKYFINDNNISYLLKLLFILICYYYFLFKWNKKGKEEAREIKLIKENEVYIAKAYLYDQKQIWITRKQLNIYIRVWDKKFHYIKNWFETQRPFIIKKENIQIYLFVFKINNKTKLDIIETLLKRNNKKSCK